MVEYMITDGVKHTIEQYPSVEHTEEGPYCGNCNRGWRKSDGAPRLRHANGSAIKFCYAVSAEWEADSRAEHAAEMAVERFFEDRGYWDARAQEDYEASMGIFS